jgi:hypothetical protein
MITQQLKSWFWDKSSRIWHWIKRDGEDSIYTCVWKSNNNVVITQYNDDNEKNIVLLTRKQVESITDIFKLMKDTGDIEPTEDE